MRRAARVWSGIVVGGLLLTACAGGDTGEASGDDGTEQTDDGDPGTDDGDPGPDDDGDPTSITVGVLPLIDVAPLYLGIDQGFFEEENLEVQVETANSGAATVTSVVAGDYQFAYTGWLPFMQARAASVPIEAVANAQYQGDPASHGEEDRLNTDVLVLEDGPIQEPADLVGETVSLNALQGVQEIYLRNSLEQAGVDPDSVSFVELPIPSMPDALENGDVAAIFASEPFQTGALNDGARVLLSPYSDGEFSANLSLYVTSEDFAGSDPDAVTSFRRAMNRSLEYAQENPDEARAIVTTYTQIPETLVEQVRLPFWTPDFLEDSIREQAAWAVDLGILEQEPDIDALIAPTRD